MRNFILIFLFVLCAVSAKSDTLRVASDNWSPFFMATETGITGIGYDIIVEIGKRTGDHLEIIHRPNLRAKVMFEEGQIDIIPVDAALWNDTSQHLYMIFSDELFKVREFVYTLKEAAIPASIEALRGKSVAIMRGYIYPLIDPLLREKAISVREYDREVTLIKLLKNSRVDAIFMDDIAFPFMAIQNNLSPNQFAKGLQLSSTSVCIKISTEKKEIAERFNRAIQKMKNDGTIDRIIEKYTKQIKKHLPS